MPRVTVIIPTYNRSEVLPFAIASVLEQMFADFELLVIGDGCTDNSAEVVNEIGDPRVTWTNIVRTGHQSGPNNEGLRRARGEFIAYLGHDDLWLPHHLSVLAAALDAGADLTHSLIAMIPPPHSRQAAIVAAQDWRPPSSVMHRRSVTEKIGGWRDYRELKGTPEGDLWQRIEAAGYEIELVPRLTAIKFPALWQRNVYQLHPFDQQEAWLARIRSEPDLEMTTLAKIVIRKKPPFAYRILRLLAHPSEWLAVVWRRKGARLRAWKRIKGVGG